MIFFIKFILKYFYFIHFYSRKIITIYSIKRNLFRLLPMPIKRIISNKLSNTDCSTIGAQFASDYDRVLTTKFQGAVSFPL